VASIYSGLQHKEELVMKKTTVAYMISALLLIMAAGCDDTGDSIGLHEDLASVNMDVPPLVWGLTVSEIVPGVGWTPGGTSVRFAGHGFLDVTDILFDTEQAEFVVSSDEELVAVAPAHAAGMVDVTLMDGHGNSLVIKERFEYVDESQVGEEYKNLKIVSILPVEGPDSGGTVALISGQGFTADVAVYFGAEEASFVKVVDSGQLVAIPVAASAAGHIDVTVVNQFGGAAVGEGAFRFYPDDETGYPSISEVEPWEVPAEEETDVTISGTGFDSSGVLLFVDYVPVETASVTAEEIAATMPPHAPAYPDVAVTNPDGKSYIFKGTFHYTDSVPRIFQVVPDHGPVEGGGTVTVKGENFEDGATVSFGENQAANVAVLSAGGITCSVPAGPGEAVVDVSVVNPDGGVDVLPGAYAYEAEVEVEVTVASVSPDSGPVEGGTTVAIEGSGFVDGTKAYFDDLELEETQVLGDGIILVWATPAHEAGLVDVMVATPDGTSASLPDGFTYTEPEPPEPPEVLQVVPASGNVVGGYTLSIIGEHFQDGAAVSLDDTEVAAEDVTWISTGIVQFVAPAWEKAETVNVTVTNPDGNPAILYDGFEYFEPEAGEVSLQFVSPHNVPMAGDVQVSVVGSGFTETSQAFVGGKALDEASVSSGNLITGLAPPAGKPGPVDVSVTTEGQPTATLQNGLVYFDADSESPYPVITSVFPLMGPVEGGTPVMLHGKNFHEDAVVLLGTAPALTLAWSADGWLLVESPAAEEAGIVDIVVYNPDGKANKFFNHFTYYVLTGEEDVPKLYSLDPDEGFGEGGLEVTLSGDEFDQNATFLVGTKPLSGVKVSGVQTATGTTRPHPLGVYDVRAINPNGMFSILEEGFEYIFQPPVIDALLPTVGPVEGGTQVVLIGSGFNKGSVVTFGNTPAIQVTYLAADSLIALSPPYPDPDNVGEGVTVSVTVTNSDGEFFSQEDAFTYVDSSVVSDAPLLYELMPEQGPLGGGNTVTLYGDNFQDTPIVMFGGEQSAEVTFLTDSVVTAVPPPSGQPETVNVAVINPDGKGTTLAGGYEYISNVEVQPKLFGVTPSFGPIGGGTSVMLTGAGFQPGAVIYFGNLPLQNLVVLNASIVTGTTPAGETGSTSIEVQNPDGGFATLEGAFEYMPAPILDGVDPAVGPDLGGTPVIIAGTDFADGANVLFGETPAENVMVKSTFVISANAPAHAPGQVDLTVVNPDGQTGTLEGGFEFLHAPQLESFFPDAGPAPGGTYVVLQGGFLHPDVDIKFGDTPAESVTWRNEGLVIAVTPPGVAGETVDLVVLNPDGQNVVAQDGFTYLDQQELAPAPAIQQATPATGPMDGGTQAVLDGTGLIEGAMVLVDMVPSQETHVVDEDVAVFVTPAAGEPAEADVMLINPDGQYAVLEGGFLYYEAPGDPVDILGVTPFFGPVKGGCTVEIQGAGFADTPVVFFGIRPALEATWDDSATLTAVTPPGPEGAVDVTVTNPDGQTVSLFDAYIYLPGPTLSGVAPNKGPAMGGTLVAVSGENFVTKDSGFGFTRIFLCDDYEADEGCELPADEEISVEGPQSLTFMAPAHVPGLKQVVAVNPDEQYFILQGGYQYTPPPVVTDVEPSKGSTLGNDEVTVTGTGFVQGSKVTFSETPSPATTFVSGTKLVALTPAHDGGVVALRVDNPDGTFSILGGAFEFVHPPDITAVYPDHGPEVGGTVVTIEGHHFKPEPDKTQVFFGNVEVEGDKVNIVSPGLLQVTSPAGQGLVSVKVANPDGQSYTLAGAFQYVPPIEPPEIISVSPSFSATVGGIKANVVGNNFLDGATAYFGDEESGWALSTETQVKNFGTLLVVTVPAHEKGIVDVKVTNTDQQSDVLEGGFEYIGNLELPELAFLKLTPSRGPEEGGQKLLILGQGFKTGVKVYVGHDDPIDPEWVELDDVLRLGPTGIIGYSPPHEAGILDLKIENPPGVGGTPDFLIVPDAYYYGFKGAFGIFGHKFPVHELATVRALVFDVDNDDLDDVVLFHGQCKHNQLFTQVVDPDLGEGTFIEVLGNPIDNTVWSNSHYPSYEAGFVVDDCNGDGSDDFVFVYNSGNIAVMTNDGTGHFKRHQSFGTCAVQKLVGDDVNCDGLKDLIIAEHNGFGRVFLGTGHCRYEEVSGRLPSLKEPSRSVAAGDADNDGDVDLFMGNDNAYQNRLYLNNCANIKVGGCIPTIPACNNVEFQGHAYAICEGITRKFSDASEYCQAYGYELATINSEAEQEFLNGERASYNYWVGHNDLEEEGLWKWLAGNSDYTHWCANQPGGGVNENCALFAFQNDPGGCWNDYGCAGGYRFICESGQKGCASEWKFNDVGYGDGETFPVSGFNTKDVMLADVNNDGWLDALVFNWGQPIRVYINAGGIFEQDWGQHLPADDYTQYVFYAEAVDIENDGDLDILTYLDVGSSKRRVELLNNTFMVVGDAVFFNITDERIPEPEYEDTYGVSLGDLNGDGLPDLFIANYNNQDWLYINNGYEEDKPWIDQNRVGDGYFANNTILGLAQHIDQTWGTDAADVDDDGDLDLIAGNWGGPLRFYENDGTGQFFDTTESRFFGDNPEKSYYRKLYFVDVNGDGDEDILALRNTTPSQYSGSVDQWVNDGDGNFTNVSDINAAKPVTILNMCIGDIDKDNDEDFVLLHPWGLYIFINIGDAYNTDGTYFFNKTGEYIAGTPGNSCELNDFNMDGYLDLFVAKGGQNVLYLYNTDTDKFDNVTTQYLPAISTSTNHARTFDFDGDGFLDIATANWVTQNRMFIGGNDYKLSDVTPDFVPQMNDASRRLLMGNIDEDDQGLMDLIFVNQRQRMTLWLNVGNSHFDDFSVEAMPDNNDDAMTGVEGDFDLDGDLDFFVGCNGQNRVYVNLNH